MAQHARSATGGILGAACVWLPWSFIMLLLMSCGEDGSGGGGACVDLGGTWDAWEEGATNQCDPTDLTTELHVYNVVQDGCSVTVTTDDGRTMSGWADGTGASLHGEYLSDSGTGTISFAGRAVASQDRNGMSGSVSWTWSDGAGGYPDCSGTTDLTGTRRSDSPATVDASGAWSGSWSSTTPAHAGLVGTFTATVTQEGSVLTGTISVASTPSMIALSNEPLQGSVGGSTITFGDIGGMVTFVGAMTGDSASGTFSFESGLDVGAWSGTRTPP